MTTKSKWLRFLPFLPALILLVTVNIFGDAGNRFHDIEDMITDSLIKGNPTYISSANLDERHLKYSLVKNMPDSVDCIALGPSTVMCVHSSDTGLDKFFNLGVSDSDIYDSLGLLGFLKLSRKHTERIIFCVDTNFFADSLYNSYAHKSLHKNLKPYAEYMINLLNGIENISLNENLSTYYNEIDLLFSLSYFQACIRYLSGMHSNNNSEYKTFSRYGVVYKGYSGAYYMPDGSLVYARKILLRDVNDVIFLSGQYDYDMNSHISSENEHASKYSKMIFEKLIQYCINNGIEIKLFLCPLAPALWDRFDNNKRPIFTELEEFAHSMAEKYSLKITGSYNPHKINIPNEAFYDARHIRRELLSKYLDFKF